MSTPTIKQRIYEALSAVLPNTYAVELPDEPTWPALVFEVNIDPEPGWVMGGGYNQCDIVVMTFSRSQEEIEVLAGQVLAAVSALDGFLGDEFAGDADYQGEADVFAYVQNFRVRIRR
ncbi:hypothetical protein IP91_02578 [Pseudoduganella lurida]|uniref:DUF3168 domain-containing protein n=1 Tax=Pseudoduganella lurida TaxID=1036180 RepID=A0A562R7Y5_9BURK|nr:hypothetical protein [Pseudoduganella lurida]TWI65171.1 hypothetical protein IP91_02578 [Pseudoduganella lurida]